MTQRQQQFAKLADLKHAISAMQAQAKSIETKLIREMFHRPNQAPLSRPYKQISSEVAPSSAGRQQRAPAPVKSPANGIPDQRQVVPHISVLIAARSKAV